MTTLQYLIVALHTLAIHNNRQNNNPDTVLSFVGVRSIAQIQRPVFEST